MCCFSKDKHKISRKIEGRFFYERKSMTPESFLPEEAPNDEAKRYMAPHVICGCGRCKGDIKHESDILNTTPPTEREARQLLGLPLKNNDPHVVFVAPSDLPAPIAENLGLEPGESGVWMTVPPEDQEILEEFTSPQQQGLIAMRFAVKNQRVSENQIPTSK